MDAEALNVVCPTCNAQPGDPCMFADERGKPHPRLLPHSARYAVAFAQQDADIAKALDDSA